MKPIRILYFDDEKWMSEILRKSLQETCSQYQINRVSTIQDFFEELESHEVYALIMLDILAPMSLLYGNESVLKHFSDSEIRDMSIGFNIGEVLHKKVRAIDRHAEIPILFYSAKPSISVQDARTAFIRKPEFANVIHDKIQSLLNLA
jgi:CheY-like chemotaxis protein